MRKNRAGRGLGLCLLLTGAAVAGLLMMEAARAGRTTAVRLCRVTAGRMEQRVAAAAQVRGAEEYAALCPVSGVVAQVYVLPGDAVTAGQPLLRLDAAAQESALSAALAAGQESGGLAQQVSAALSVPETGLQEAAASRRATELAGLRQALEMMTVRAPADGVVQQVLVAEHGGVVAGSAAVTMSSLAQEVRCALVPRDAERVAVGMEAYLRQDGALVGTAEVTRVAPPSVDAETGVTVQLVTLQPREPLSLPVGAQVDAEIVLEAHEGAALLPLTALCAGNRVWWLAEGRVWQTEVEVLMRDTEMCWVNLPVGTAVVDSPTGLTEGARVEVAE